ncbi:MAG: hypothetical protein WCG27_06100, partial [Pseudomonadota bacterium]
NTFLRESKDAEQQLKLKNSELSKAEEEGQKKLHRLEEGCHKSKMLQQQLLTEMQALEDHKESVIFESTELKKKIEELNDTQKILESKIEGLKIARDQYQLECQEVEKNNKEIKQENLQLEKIREEKQYQTNKAEQEWKKVQVEISEDLTTLQKEIDQKNKDLIDVKNQINWNELKKEELDRILKDLKGNIDQSETYKQEIYKKVSELKIINSKLGDTSNELAGKIEEQELALKKVSKNVAGYDQKLKTEVEHFKDLQQKTILLQSEENRLSKIVEEYKIQEKYFNERLTQLQGQETGLMEEVRKIEKNKTIGQDQMQMIQMETEKRITELEEKVQAIKRIEEEKRHFQYNLNDLKVAFDDQNKLYQSLQLQTDELNIQKDYVAKEIQDFQEKKNTYQAECEGAFTLIQEQKDELERVELEVEQRMEDFNKAEQDYLQKKEQMELVLKDLADQKDYVTKETELLIELAKNEVVILEESKVRTMQELEKNETIAAKEQRLLKRLIEEKQKMIEELELAGRKVDLTQIEEEDKKNEYKNAFLMSAENDLPTASSEGANLAQDVEMDVATSTTDAESVAIDENNVIIDSKDDPFKK